MTLTDWFHILQIFWPAVLLSAGLALAAGTAGIFVVLKRQGLAALALPQVVALGIAVGLRLAWPTPPLAIAAVTLFVLLIATSRTPANAEAMLAACFVGAIALTMLILANSGQHLAEVQNRFVGVDVAVSEEQALILAPTLALLAASLALPWRRWTLVSLTPGVAELAGVRPGRWNALFLALLAAIVLLGTLALGNMMVLAMLFLPAGAVLPWARRIPVALAAAGALGLGFLAAGFVLSVLQDWPFSQSVAGVGFSVLVLSRLSRLLLSR